MLPFSIVSCQSCILYTTYCILFFVVSDSTTFLSLTTATTYHLTPTATVLHPTLYLFACACMRGSQTIDDHRTTPAPDSLDLCV